MVRPLYTRESSGNIGPVPKPDRDDSGWWIGQRYSLGDLQAVAEMVAEDLICGVDGFSIEVDPSILDQDRADSANDSPSASSSTSIEHALERLFSSSGPLPSFLLLQSSLPPREIATGALEWLGRCQKGKELRLGLGIDPLGEAAHRGRLPTPEHELGVLMREGFELVDPAFVSARALSVSTRRYADAGADGAYEMAVALATAVDYVRRLDEQGIDASKSAAKIVFHFAIGKDFFSEIAKLRAFRILWTRLVTKTFGVDTPHLAWIHADTAMRSLTAWDVSTNLLRSTNATLAAVLGGADTVSAAAFDILQHGGSSRGRRLARNTQHILKEESFLGRVGDPAAGSYYIESLTSEMTLRAWSQFQDIERSGGMVTALVKGEIQETLAQLWEQRRRRFADRSDPITGVSFFASPGQDSPPEANHPSSVSAVDPGSWCWTDSGNTQPIPSIRCHRDSEEFEALRERTERLTRSDGYRPRVFLVPIPNRAEARDTISFARNLFCAAGFEIEVLPVSEEASPRQEMFQSARHPVVCICVGRDVDEEQIALQAKAARQAGAGVLMGASMGSVPGGSEWERSVDTTVSPGVEAVALLGDLIDSFISAKSTEK
ncbi:MAG: methylmalonyl-CoA mutase family protein [Acidobacteriota bacterium]